PGLIPVPCGSKLIFMNLFLSFLFAFTTFAAGKFDSQEKLAAAVQAETAYFVPANRDDVMSWTGTLYNYETKTCFNLKQINEAVQASPEKCPKTLVQTAAEPYDLISDFEKVKNKFLSCLEKQDKVCLRRLTWKRVQISFGVDGF